MIVPLLCVLATLTTPVRAETWAWEPLDTLGDSTCRVPIVRGYGSVVAWTGREVLVWPWFTLSGEGPTHVGKWIPSVRTGNALIGYDTQGLSKHARPHCERLVRRAQTPSQT